MAKTDHKPAATSASHSPTSSNLLILLISLVFILLIVPQVDTDYKAFFHVGLTCILLSGAFVNRRFGPVFIPGLLLVAIAIPVTWASMWIDNAVLFVVGCLVEAAFFLLTAGFVIQSVLRKHIAHVHSIYGAISGYLLIGLSWAVLYLALERIDGESLDFANRLTETGGDGDGVMTRFSQLVYFSFVTMSTLGYGDISPLTPLAQTLTWTQSVTGQFYIAVLVSLIVAELTAAHRFRRVDESESTS